MLESPT